MKRLLIIGLAAISAAVVSCQKEDTMLDGSLDGVPIEVTTTINAANEVTRSGSTTYSGETLSLTVDYGESDRYTSTDVKWTNTNGTWSADQYWKDSKTAAKLYAYAPYQDEVSDYAAIPFSAATDQSGGTLSSDLVGYATDSYTPTSATLDIPFKHVMSQVVFNVTYSTETFPEADFTGTPEVSAAVGASYDATTATATASGSVVSITPLTSLPTLEGDETSATRTYTAIVSPQTIANGATLLDLGSVGGKNLCYQPNEQMVLEGGNSYIFNLTITSTYALALSSDVVVNDGWEDSTDLGSVAITTIDITYNATDSYYEIYTAKGLKAFADLVNGSGNSGEVMVLGANPNFDSTNTSINGRLMCDIDLSTICYKGADEDGSEDVSWTPIGNYESSSINSTHKYSGIFNGNDYEVQNLYINTATDYQGLFGYISDATIHDLGVTGSVTAIQKAHCGGIVGYASGSFLTSCYSNATVNSSYHTGGVAGGAYNTKLTLCYNSASVNGNDQNTGGVVGYISNSSLTSCSNSALVSGGNFYTGGVVGAVNDSCSITSCYNEGAVKGSYPSTGGIAGLVKGSSTLTLCYNSANVSGESTDTGGIAGSVFDSIITSCYNSATVSGTLNNTGGIAGYLASSATLVSCYNEGAVKSSNSCTGGVAGNVNQKATITSCYSAGAVSSTSNSSLGGVLGQNYNNSESISYCYYDNVTVDYGKDDETYVNSPIGAVSNENYEDETVDKITYTMGLTTTAMKGSTSDLLTGLNSGIDAWNETNDPETSGLEDLAPWVGVDNDYPKLSWQ